MKLEKLPWIPDSLGICNEEQRLDLSNAFSVPTEITLIN